MAAVTAPERTAAQHQSLLHFVGEGGWSDERVLAKVRQMVLPAIERHGPIEAWIIDDTGFPKKGRHSVGVARQYCGQLGKQDNCQVAVSLSLANADGSLPVAYRLYLPQDWAADAARRKKAGVPEEIGFQDQARDRARSDPCRPCGGPAAWGRADGCGLRRPQRSAHGDHGAGSDLCRRHSVEHHGVGARHGAAAAQAWSGRGRPPKLPAPRRRASAGLGQGPCPRAFRTRAWRTITWREGTAEPLSSRFARLRVRIAHRDYRAQRAVAGRMAADRMAQGRERSRQNTGCRPCRRTSPLPVWSISPSCAGASSATIRSSSRSSASDISRDAAGAASIITPRSASQPTAS